MQRDGSNRRRVLVLAPRGRDAVVIEHVLSGLDIAVEVCANLAELTAGLCDETTAAILTEESLNEEGALSLQHWIESQPPWSDFPFVVLATRQPARRSVNAAAALARLGNEVLLERPLNADTLVSAANSAIRSRRRQYDARRQLEQFEAVALENQRLFEAERRARAEAEAANRATDDFLATLSHELRTPLSAILGWTYVLQRRRAELGELARGIDTIQRNANSQARLIEDLLDMSRIVAGKVSLELQTVVPSQLIEQVVSSLLPSAQSKGIELVTVLDPALAPITGDPQRLLQVFRNLIVNALKFTPDGGVVRVEAAEEGETLVVQVVDNGVGISADFLPHVFERFRQADGSTTRSQGGLGLGLAIVSRLVELHGGSIAALSDGIGEGATFTVRLPPIDTAQPTREAANDAEHDPPAVPKRILNLRILLVEDDPDGREMVRQLLLDEGGEVVAVDSAARALLALRDALFDLIVSDIGMPEIDGYEFMKRIRDTGNPIPAIALTAFARPEDKARALEVGYSAHISKPVEPPALIAAVAGVMHSGR
ncbi:ATP-binding protein [Rhizobacter sp. OV335]|uniref:hybrid sensor histidine kinase/response regulator n=1 Tax=Rhizobacter sp. OV335 TaxID=1500264 RepID=UPI00090EE86C|nr:ATP-binding protein [Rhizobacter sp. OV335]SHN31505.1 Signal transduction histidine kinase [Rhizobacter sp. OV335]